MQSGKRTLRFLTNTIPQSTISMGVAGPPNMYQFTKLCDTISKTVISKHLFIYLLMYLFFYFFRFFNNAFNYSKFVLNSILSFKWTIRAGCTNTGCQVVQMTKFRIVVSKICESSLWNFFRTILPAHRILNWLLDYVGFINCRTQLSGGRRMLFIT